MDVVSAGLGCWYPGCSYKGNTWTKLKTHAFTRHEAKLSDWEDTHFLEAFRAERAECARAEYTAKTASKKGKAKAKATSKDKARKTEKKDKGKKGKVKNDKCKQAKTKGKPKTKENANNDESSENQNDEALFEDLFASDARQSDEEMVKDLFGSDAFASDEDNEKPAAKEFQATAPAIAPSANSTAGSSTDGSTALLAALESQATEALGRQDYKLLDYLFEKAERLRNQLNERASARQAATYAPSTSRENSKVLDALERLERGGQEVPIPDVKPNEEALNWDGVYKLGSKWPFKATTRKFEIDGLMPYLKDSRRNKKATLVVHQRGLNYAFRLMDVGSENYSDIGVFQAIHDNKIIQALREKPILDLEPTWTRVIATSLSVTADYLLDQCERTPISRHVKHALTLFKKDVIEPWVQDITFKRKEQQLARQMLDQERLKHYMPIEVAKETIKQVMVDLWLVGLIHKDSENISHFMQTVANICMVWIVVVTGTFGRSGELANLTDEEVNEALATARKWLKIVKHKTFKTQGPLGRHLVDGAWTGVKTYKKLPAVLKAKVRDPEPFLKPACPSHDTVDVYRLLKRGGAVLCPGYTFPRTQLNRKWMSRAVRKDENQAKCAKWVAEWNAHLDETGRDIYDTDRTDPEQQAIKGKHMVDAFFGEEVTWPTAEELPACSKEEASKILWKKYGKHVSTNDEDKAAGEDTEVEDEEGEILDEDSIDNKKEPSAEEGGEGATGDSPGNGEEQGGADDAAKVGDQNAESEKEEGESVAEVLGLGKNAGNSIVNKEEQDAEGNDEGAPKQDKKEEDGSASLDAGNNKSAQDSKAPRSAFEYDAVAGQFKKAEHRNPRIIEHAPLPKYIQPTIQEVVADSKRKRGPELNRHLERQRTGQSIKHTSDEKAGESSKNEDKLSRDDENAIMKHEGHSRQRTPGYMPLTFFEKKYLVLQYRRSHKTGNALPDNTEIRQILKDGQASDDIGKQHDLQNVRTFFRYFCQVYTIEPEGDHPGTGSASAGVVADAN